MTSPARARIELVAVEAAELVAAGERDGVSLRAVGGIAIWQRLDEPLREAYAEVRPVPGDLDLLAPRGASEGVQGVFRARGYVADERMLSWHGEHRHRYFRELGDEGLEVDVFLGAPPSCHDLELDFAAVAPATATAMATTELLLQKLQIVEVNHKDLLDTAFVIAAGDIDVERVARQLARDWGFWHTATTNLEGLAGVLAGDVPAQLLAAVPRVEALRAAIEAEPKSRKWKMRARVGTRVPWYTEVEELDR
jgi:hypothetical protein